MVPRIAAAAVGDEIVHHAADALERLAAVGARQYLALRLELHDPRVQPPRRRKQRTVLAGRQSPAGIYR